MGNPFKPRGGIIVVSPPPSKHEPVDFTAPVGRRVRSISLLCYGLLGVFVVTDVALAFTQRVPPRHVWIMALAPLVGAAVVLPVARFAQVRGYRLAKDELLVLRRNRQTRVALAGLQSADVDSGAMAWSIKILGNDGLGAITGRFYNRKLGAYEALVTDRDRAVVLRWPGRCLVVSPDRPEEFAAQLRARAGLKG